MSTVPPAKPPIENQPPQSRSSLRFILLGCGGLLLLLIVLCAGGSLFGVRWATRQLGSLTKEYEDRGYKKQMGQVITVSETPDDETVYMAQVLHINAEVDVDIAAVCQVVEVRSDIHGDLDVTAQVLKVHPDATIHGDVRVKNAQVVEIQGDVTGKISGNYGVLVYKGKRYGPGEGPNGKDPDKLDDLMPEAPLLPDEAVPPIRPSAPEPPAVPSPPTPQQ